MRMKIACLVLACLGFLSFQARADNAPLMPTADEAPLPSGFTFTCKALDVSVTFVSPTHQDADDNMTATISSHEFTKDLAIPPGGYSLFNDHTTGQKAVCEGDGTKIQAYPVDQDKILLFVASDHHPSIPDIVAFLINTRTLTLLDAKDIGISKDDEPGVIPTSQGFKVRMVKDSHVAGITCDCSARYLDAWMKIWVQNGQIATQWIKD